MSIKMKKYQREDLIVQWKPDLCIHSEICAKGLGKVFDPKRKPWIDLERAEKDKIRKQVLACPSGALSLDDDQSDASASNPNPSVQIELIPDGPLKLSSMRGPIEMGNEVISGKSCFLCRCGASENKPYCDGSHKKIGFSA
ncbi:MAG: hypothetical protein HKN87_07990 [Saprospiraceae bacterium]|nr:hypothetical protein [Saprospiraceae bacterium]